MRRIKSETFNIRIVIDKQGDGLERHPTFLPEATNILDYRTLEMIEVDFDHMAGRIDDSRVEIDRVLHYWCNHCHGYIGNRSIPLIRERFRPVEFDRYDKCPSMEVNTEQYVCQTCHHTTGYTTNLKMLLAG